MSVTRAVRNLAAALSVLAASSAIASSHREAPLISNDPAADATDLYAWRRGAVGANATVVFAANYWPLALPPGGPNFYSFDDNVLYEIKIDNTGDSRPDVVYEFRFKTTIKKSPLMSVVGGDSFLYAFAPVNSATSANLLRAQTVTVAKVITTPFSRTVLGTNLPVAPWPVGKITTPNYATQVVPSAIHTFPGGASFFAGPREDPFFVNLSKTFDFLDYPPTAGDDTLKGINVLSIVLEVPASEVVGGVGPVVDCAVDPCASRRDLGIWTTASRPRVTVRRGDGSVDGHGPFIQVSRLGNPLINEAIVPMRFKDFFNASQPADDLSNYAAVVLDPELPHLLHAKNFIPKVPPPPRTDLVAALVNPSETLHLNVAVPPSATENRLGGAAGDRAGFPNGRRLADDITDIALKVVGGALYQALGAQDANDIGSDGGPTDYATAAGALGDNVDTNDVPFLTAFPYLAHPNLGNP